MAGPTMRHELYDGDVVLAMDARHRYRVTVRHGKPRPVPNVTSIGGMKDKSRPLMSWAPRLAAEAFEKSPPPLGIAMKMDEIQRENIKQAIRTAHDGVRDTADFIGDVDGKMTIADWKTSKDVHDGMPMQVSAYQAAFEEEFAIPIEQRAIGLRDNETGDFEWIVLPDTHERDLEAFFACKTLYHFDSQAWKDIKARRDQAVA